MNDSKFLKKYLKSKKHKTERKSFGNFKIIDDDVQLKKIFKNTLKHESSEEDPVIANVIDERPEKIIQMEAYQLNNHWNIITSSKDQDYLSPSEVNTNINNDDSNTIQKSLISNILFEQKYITDEDLSPKRKSTDDCNIKISKNYLFNEKISLFTKSKNKNIDILQDVDNQKLDQASNMYKKWNSGIKQQEMFNNKMIDILHEIEKPMARYSDNMELDERLRQTEHSDDPMLNYIRKRNQRTLLNASFRIYKGPEAPPNRFNLRPGYRWDGVDRSNGFEAKYFSNLNERKVFKDMAYRWSTEDM